MKTLTQLNRELREWRKAAKHMSRTNSANAGPLWDRVARIESEIEDRMPLVSIHDPRFPAMPHFGNML